MAYTSASGYKKSVLSTHHLADLERLTRELIARQLRCEIFDCWDAAVYMAPTGLSQLMCATHSYAYLSSPKVAKALDESIKANLRFLLMEIANHAYEGAEDGVVIIMRPGDDIRSLAKEALGRAEDFLEGVRRRELAAINAVMQMPSFSIVQVPSVTPVRPTLRTLNSSIEEYSSIDLFQFP